MEKKDFVLINREALKNIIRRSHCWCTIVQESEVLEEIKPEDLDAMMLRYADGTGLAFPEGVSGSEALDILSEWDIDVFHEVLEYDKREND